MTYDDAYHGYARRRTDLRDVAARHVTAHERYLYGDWTLGVDPASSAPATVVWARRDDRGDAVYVEPTTEIETEERTTVTTTTEATDVDTALPPEPGVGTAEPIPALTLRTVPAFGPTTEPTPPTTTQLDLAAVGPLLTLTGFRELNPCGPYIRAFGEHFPSSRFPRGVAICEDVCRRHAGHFDWGWAASVMLTHAGLGEYQRLRDSRARAVRERFGPAGEERRAAIFGDLFANHPGYRSPLAVTALRSAEERADEVALRDLNRARRDLEQARHQLAEFQHGVSRWERVVADREAALPALEAACAGAEARRAHRTVEEAAALVAQAEAALADRRTALEAARAEAARNPLPEPTTDPAPPADDVTNTELVF